MVRNRSRWSMTRHFKLHHDNYYRASEASQRPSMDSESGARTPHEHHIVSHPRHLNCEAWMPLADETCWTRSLFCSRSLVESILFHFCWSRWVLSWGTLELSRSQSPPLPSSYSKCLQARVWTSSWKMPHHGFCRSQDCLALKVSSDAAAGVTLANGMERKFINGSKPFYSQYTIKKCNWSTPFIVLKRCNYILPSSTNLPSASFNFLFFFLGIPGNYKNFRVSSSRFFKFQIPDSRLPNFLSSWIVFVWSFLISI